MWAVDLLVFFICEKTEFAIHSLFDWKFRELVSVGVMC